jgi:RNA polymerase sigma-70 factor (ECF subfamily)
LRDIDRDEKAARLYDEHADRVYRFCYRLSGNRTEAEDLAAETFFAALDAQFRGEADELTFLYRIALNKWRMHCRRQSVRRRFESLIGRHAGSAPELRVALDEAIDGLPRNLRIAFILVKVEGFTNAEAAALLECPMGTVQSRVFKACEALRLSLSDAPQEQNPAALMPAEESCK